jgi:hypothetical protein
LARWIWRGRNSETKDLPFLLGWLSAIPEGRSLLLDQTAEWLPLWSRFNEYSFFGKDFIWCAMSSMGGGLGMYGDMGTINTEPIKAFNTNVPGRNVSSAVGVGIDPEGIDNNPAYYTMVLESAWRKEAVDLPTWFSDWSRQRCGKASQSAEKAWKLLGMNTVYAHAPQQVRYPHLSIYTRHASLSRAPSTYPPRTPLADLAFATHLMPPLPALWFPADV